MLKTRNIFAHYPSPDERHGVLADLCNALLDDQKATWPMVREGLTALEKSITREISCRGFFVHVQYNPGRIISTGAKVDEQSIRDRACFLCADNLPEDQKGILCFDNYFILCNPVPIFRHHYTVVCKDHLPQAFEPWITDFLVLTAEFGQSLTLFYNGARCGASAPDHMHFQACSSGIIPIERDTMETSRRDILKTIKGVEISTLKEYGRGIILIESKNIDECASAIRRCIAVMRELCNDPEEPMINVIGNFRDLKWRVAIIPRRKHRPSLFFADDRMIISPAAVDMGGLIITPVEKDFRTIDAGLIESIYHEVGVSRDRIVKYVERI
jgi:hypothetical protein